jgi:carbamate kinase
MRVVVALGGNSLLERGERPDAAIQLARVQRAADCLAGLAGDHELVITHGNGPQVGVIAEESAADRSLSVPYPLDVLGAETQGMIGYWLAQSLRNALGGRAVATLVCQTAVDAHDPAFGRPSKFVGPTYGEAAARALSAEHGWPVRQDGTGWRRVVASPEPVELLELPAVEALLAGGVIPICAGGGGVPVVRDPEGSVHGVEAVIDKDLVASLLARALRAEALLVLTDVPAVMRDFGTAEATEIRAASPAELRALELPAGSMGPKVEAVCRHVETGGKLAVIGRLEDAALLLDGRAGTVVRPTA